MSPQDLLQGKAAATLIPQRLHRSIPVPTGGVPETLIPHLPAPEAVTVIPRLQNPIVHLPVVPADQPGQAAAGVTAVAEEEEAAAAEAAEVVRIVAVAVVVHAAAGDNLKIYLT